MTGVALCRAFAQYACRIKRNKYREEIVQDMTDDIMALLKLFRVRNEGVKPESIVVYRDGVSHGEFKKVCSADMQSIDSQAQTTAPLCGRCVVM